METGLHYNRFRYYDSDVGMFIQRDPIGLLGGWNVFAYVISPSGFIDPMGLSSTALGKSMQKNGMKPSSVSNFNRSEWEAHHLTPEEVWNNQANKNFFKDIGLKGKGNGRDSWTNGIFLPSTPDLANANNFAHYHRGSHNTYSQRVAFDIKNIRDNFYNSKQTISDKKIAVQAVKDLQKSLFNILNARKPCSANAVRVS